jgi:hypothetical protein
MKKKIKLSIISINCISIFKISQTQIRGKGFDTDFTELNESSF